MLVSVSQSSRGLEHSKTLRVDAGRRTTRQRHGLPRPSAAFPGGRPKCAKVNRNRYMILNNHSEEKPQSLLAIDGLIDLRYLNFGRHETHSHHRRRWAAGISVEENRAQRFRLFLSWPRGILPDEKRFDGAPAGGVAAAGGH